MTHLGLGSSLEEPWGELLGGGVVELSSWEIVLFSWEDWGALCLGGHLRSCLTDLVGLLICPAWGELVAWEILFPLLEGRRAVAWEELPPSLEGSLTLSPSGKLCASIQTLVLSRWDSASSSGLPENSGFFPIQF